MRNKDLEIKDRKTIDSIIEKSIVCRIAMCDDSEPYIVPVCFGYDGKDLFIHSAPLGKKIETMKKNCRVCFEFDILGELQQQERFCEWGIEYKSVVGVGKAVFIDDIEEKKKALGTVVKQYSGQDAEFNFEGIKHIAIIRIEIESITGRSSK